MLTRRDLLRLIPSSMLLSAAARAAGPPTYERIDTHIHIHRDAPAIAASLKAGNWRALDIVVCGATGDEAFDLEEKARGHAQAFNNGKLRRLLAWASTFDARPFEQPGFAERAITGLRQTFDDGAIAVKIWKTIGMAIKSKAGAYLLPDDPALLPIYEAIQKANRTLVAHLAEPNGAWMPLDARNPEINYYSNNPQWHMYGKPSAPVKEAILKSRDRLLAKYPKLRVVGCHLGSDEDDLTQLAKRLDAYPNFAVDTAARIRYFARGDRDKVREFLMHYQDRVLYATDYSYRDGDDSAAALSLKATHDRDWDFFSNEGALAYNGIPTQGLALPGEVLQKIFHQNALRWFPGFRKCGEGPLLAPGSRSHLSSASRNELRDRSSRRIPGRSECAKTMPATTLSEQSGSRRGCRYRP